MGADTTPCEANTKSLGQLLHSKADSFATETDRGVLIGLASYAATRLDARVGGTADSGA